jgi:periplasmic divalent cation tolerance protein
MKRAKPFVIALVTAPDVTTARKLAKSALGARLVACANLIPKIESHFWWQGKIETASEVLVLFKTTTRRLAALEKLVLAQHPYDTPEFVVLSVQDGNQRYLEWWARSISH